MYGGGETTSDEVEVTEAAEAAPWVSEACSISSANDPISAEEVFERETEPEDLEEAGLGAMLERCGIGSALETDELWTEAVQLLTYVDRRHRVRLAPSRNMGRRPLSRPDG